MEKIIVGDIDWLRNDYICDVLFGGITYPSVEHAYQAAKFRDKNKKLEIKNADLKEALRIGRKTDCVRDDWDSVRESIMLQLLRAKFTQNDLLAERLAKTGTDPIVMEGYNSFWGTGRDGSGENVLGQLLEGVRSEVRAVIDVDLKGSVKPVVPLFKQALLYDMDDSLATTCQELYDNVSEFIKLIDCNDHYYNTLSDIDECLNTIAKRLKEYPEYIGPDPDDDDYDYHDDY